MSTTTVSVHEAFDRLCTLRRQALMLSDILDAAAAASEDGDWKPPNCAAFFIGLQEIADELAEGFDVALNALADKDPVVPR
jgi:hypothetical protein